MYAEQNSGVYRRCPNTATLGMDRNAKDNEKITRSKYYCIDAHCPEDVGDRILELNNYICVYKKQRETAMPFPSCVI